MNLIQDTYELNERFEPLTLEEQKQGRDIVVKKKTVTTKLFGFWKVSEKETEYTIQDETRTFVLDPSYIQAVRKEGLRASEVLENLKRSSLEKSTAFRKPFQKVIGALWGILFLAFPLVLGGMLVYRESVHFGEERVIGENYLDTSITAGEYVSISGKMIQGIMEDTSYQANAYLLMSSDHDMMGENLFVYKYSPSQTEWDELGHRITAKGEAQSISDLKNPFEQEVLESFLTDIREHTAKNPGVLIGEPTFYIDGTVTQKTKETEQLYRTFYFVVAGVFGVLLLLLFFLLYKAQKKERVSLAVLLGRNTGELPQKMSWKTIGGSIIVILWTGALIAAAVVLGLGYDPNTKTKSLVHKGEGGIFSRINVEKPSYTETLHPSAPGRDQAQHSRSTRDPIAEGEDFRTQKDIEESVRAIEILGDVTGAYSLQQQEEMVREVMEHSEEYVPLVLYILSDYLYFSERYDEATFWYYAAQVRARFDAERCTDERAQGVVDMLNEEFGAYINEYALWDIEKLRSVVMMVLEWDKTTLHSYDHEWIHAMIEGEDMGTLASVPKDSWHRLAEQNRRNYLLGFTSMVEEYRDYFQTLGLEDSGMQRPSFSIDIFGF